MNYGIELRLGVHYVGKSAQDYLKLVCDDPVEWAPMGNQENGYTYDRIVLNGEEVAFQKDPNILKAHLGKIYHLWE